MSGLSYSKDLIEILIKAAESKIYGSVEVYFEDGRVTQITQRIINKVSNRSESEERVGNKVPESL